jgi:hypothetical protein
MLLLAVARRKVGEPVEAVADILAEVFGFLLYSRKGEKVTGWPANTVLSLREDVRWWKRFREEVWLSE